MQVGKQVLEVLRSDYNCEPTSQEKKNSEMVKKKDLNVSLCFRLSIRPILVNVMSQAHLEGISSNLLPMSTMTQ